MQRALTLLASDHGDVGQYHLDSTDSHGHVHAGPGPGGGEFVSGGSGGAGGAGSKSTGKSAGKVGGTKATKGGGTGKAAKTEKAPKETAHERAARLQKEQGLRAEVQPTGGYKQKLQAIGKVDEAKLDPYAPTDPHTLAKLYGEHQLGAALARYSPDAIKKAIETHYPEMSAKGSKAALITRIVVHETAGRYSANFAKATAAAKSTGQADKVAAMHATHQTRISKLRQQLAKAEATYTAAAAKHGEKPKLAEMRRRITELRRALATEQRGVRLLSEQSRGATQGLPTTLQRVIRLDEGQDGFHRSWIMLFAEGDYDHAEYGHLHLTHSRLQRIKQLFDQRVRHIDIALDQNHDQDKATGWLEQVELRPPQLAPDGQETPAGMWGLVRWTPLGVQLLKDQIYRYFSPEFGPWTDPETHEEYDDVLIGGGLTNRPFLKKMAPIQLAGDGRAVSRRPWGDVDKGCLPDSAFLDPTNRRLPIYEGTGPKDAQGRYTKRGALNLNGVRAALAAVHGARSGKAMTGLPAGTAAKLERLLQRYGGSGSNTNKAASEQDARRVQRQRHLIRRKDGEDKRVGSKYDHDEDEDAGTLTPDEERELLEVGRRLLADRKLLAAKSAKGKAAAAKSGKGGKAGTKYDDDGDGDSDGGDQTMDDDGGDGGDSAELDDSGDDDGGGTYDDDGGDGGDSAELDDGGDADSAELDDMDGNAAEGEDLDDGSEDDDSTESDGAKVPGPRQGRSGKAGLKAGPKKGTQKTFRDASFAATGGMTLAEQRRVREELAEARYQLYEVEVGKTLAGWRKQSFQFSERNAKSVATRREGRIALAPTFERAYRAFMLNEGIRLAPSQRRAVSALVEQALSTAVVDLTQRGVSFDQETRRTTKMSEGGRGAGGEKSATLDDVARKIALSEGKQLEALKQAELLELYTRAAKEIDYD